MTELLTTVFETIKGIVQAIMKLNVCYNKNREQLIALEKNLNNLGNPGLYFEDSEPFAADYRGEEYILCSNGGKIQFVSFKEEYVRNHNYNESYDDLQELPLCLIERMLEKLPIFLSAYHDYIQENTSLYEKDLEKITAVNESIVSALASHPSLKEDGNEK